MSDQLPTTQGFESQAPQASPAVVAPRRGMTWRDTKYMLGGIFLGVAGTIVAEAGLIVVAVRNQLARIDSVGSMDTVQKENEVLAELDNTINKALATDKVRYESYSSLEQSADNPDLNAFDHFVQKVKDESKGRIVVVDFFADWCPPCHRIAPNVMPGALESGLDVTVIKVDEEDNRKIIEGNITYYPQLHIVKDGQLIGLANAEDVLTEEGFSNFLKKAAANKNPKPWPPAEPARIPEPAAPSRDREPTGPLI